MKETGQAGRVRAWVDEARALLRLGVPLAATQLAQMMILATDTVMLGHYSKSALAAAALGNTLFVIVWLFGGGPTMAVSPVIAHIRGEQARSPRPRGHKDVRAAVRMGFWLAALMSPPLMAILFFTPGLLVFFRQTPQLAADAGVFMSGLLFGLPFALGFMVLRNFVTALDRALPPLIVMALAVLFNALADYALIFGHFGLPRLGLRGSGIASALSNLFSFVVMLGVVLLTPELRRYRVLHRLTQADWARFAELLRLGLPMSVTMLFEIGLFNAATLAMGTFGLAALAAHQIALTIPSLTFMVPLGIGMAATVRVGHAMGAGDARGARRAGFAAMGVSLAFMGCTALLLLLFARQIAMLWLPDSAENRDVLALAVTFLQVAAAFQLADGLQVTAAQSLRGLKDTRAPMWLAGASYWLAGAPMCAVLGFGLGLKGLGIWLGLAFGLSLAAATLTARFAALSGRGLRPQT